MTTTPISSAGRKRICRLLVIEHGSLDRCTGEELEDTGLCWHHLGRAANDFHRLTDGGWLTIRDGELAINYGRTHGAA